MPAPHLTDAMDGETKASLEAESLSLRRIIEAEGDFAACLIAERFLTKAGFSVGRMQRGDPRGIMLGEYDIQKWRNLSARDRKGLHGVLVGNMREGPITIQIYPHAPHAAKTSFLLTVHDEDVGDTR